MGFRFRKSIKLFPGVRLNLSKSGVSTSIGRPGATINISARGTRATVGLPGTGLSYSEKVSAPTGDQPDGGAWLLWVIAVVVVGMVIYGLT